MTGSINLRRFGAALLIGPLLFAVPAGAATPAAFDPYDPGDCGYPLGAAAENGRFSILSEGSDPEFAIVDASFAHATKTQHSVVSLWGTLHMVYDGRWRIGDGGGVGQGGSRHNIQIKSFTEKGWNSSTQYASNPDVTNVTPIGNALNPRAVAYHDQLWIVFARESADNFQVNGTPIMLRYKSSDGNWSDYIQATDPNWTSINQQPDLLVVGDKLLIVWISTQGAVEPADQHLLGRFYDGAAFSPVFNISRQNDGLGEGAFTLATDGTRAAAAWISFNVSSPQPSYLPKFAVFDGTAWSPEVDLWSENDSLAYVAAVEFYRDTLYLVFDTNDPALTHQGDYDVFMRTADPTTLELSPIIDLVEPTNTGDDVQPEMERYDGKLWLVWASSDDVLTRGPDIDLVVKSFDGTSWTAPRDALADEKWPNDAQRAEFTEHEGALVLNWIELVKPPGSTAKDQRMALRVLERGPRWYDGLEAHYTLVGAAPAPGENATFTVSFGRANESTVASPWFSVRPPSGAWSRLNGTGPNYTVTVPFNNTAIRPFAVFACGKPVTLLQADGPSPGAPVPSPALGPAIILLALLAVAVAAGAGRRRFRRAARK